MVSDRRAQVFTLEAFIAGLLVLSSVTFALSVTAATPLSASTASQHVETQEVAYGSGLVGTAQATGILKPTLLSWNDTNARFHGASDRGYFRSCGFETAFGRLLATTLADHGLTCTVRVSYHTGAGTIHHEQLVYPGAASANAVTVRTSVALYDDDVLRDDEGTPTATRLVDAGTFYAPDVAPTDRLYNVVVVEVNLWRA